MHSVDEVLGVGETVEVSDDIEHIEAEAAGSGIRLFALYRDKPKEHVLLEEKMDGEVEIHSRSKVVNVVEGSGMANARIVYLLPLKYYGG